jgi:hypothetical protein
MRIGRVQKNKKNLDYSFNVTIKIIDRKKERIRLDIYWRGRNFQKACRKAEEARQKSGEDFIIIEVKGRQTGISYLCYLNDRRVYEQKNK